MVEVSERRPHRFYDCKYNVFFENSVQENNLFDDVTKKLLNYYRRVQYLRLQGDFYHVGGMVGDACLVASAFAHNPQDFLAIAQQQCLLFLQE